MAKCVGCDKEHTEIGGYDPEDDPIETDGTYHNGKFVCDGCYIKLIMRGEDIGPARVIQERMLALKEESSHGR